MSLLAFGIMRPLAAKNKEAALGAGASDSNAAGLTAELPVVGTAFTVFLAGRSNRSASGRHGRADKEQRK